MVVLLQQAQYSGSVAAAATQTRLFRNLLVDMNGHCVAHSNVGVGIKGLAGANCQVNLFRNVNKVTTSLNDQFTA